ncbi:MAG: methionyl-tRNA formyltransferase [Candidatus Paceibacterota bacterium]|jgi:methionyl-tRNA formyltransferase
MFKNDIKIAFFGTSEFSLIVLKELKNNGIVPELIVTVPDKQQGRKMILTPTPTKVWAQENGIEYVEPVKLKDETFLNKIKNYNLHIVASYGKIIPKIVIDMPKYQMLNIHPSLLPKYRGPSPLQEQILNDEKEIGVSIMLIDEQVDHGKIIAQKKVGIPEWPVGFFELQETLAKEGAKILGDMLPDWIKGKIKAQAQNDSQATFTKKVEKQDGFLDLNSDAHKNYLKILAYEDWPKTYFEIEKNGGKMRVIITKADWKEGKLEILKVIPEGKKEMSYTDFLRGLK